MADYTPTLTIEIDQVGEYTPTLVMDVADPETGGNGGGEPPPRPVRTTGQLWPI